MMELKRKRVLKKKPRWAYSGMENTRRGL